MRLHQHLASISTFSNKLFDGVKSANTGTSSSLRAWSSKNLASKDFLTGPVVKGQGVVVLN